MSPGFFVLGNKLLMISFRVEFQFVVPFISNCNLDNFICSLINQRAEIRSPSKENQDLLILNENYEGRCHEMFHLCWAERVFS